jgi:hypothetical protein
MFGETYKNEVLLASLEVLELSEPASARSTRIRKTKHCIGITVRVDPQTLLEIDEIAFFEKIDRAVWIRKILMEKIQVYKRNPKFKFFLRTMTKTIRENEGGE